jgi:arylsulfatase A-like enzyme
MTRRTEGVRPAIFLFERHPAHRSARSSTKPQVRRPDPWRRAVAALALGSTLACAARPPEEPADRPNIVYIMMDEWGYFEWSAMGHPILDTPHIDQLASEGMRFTQLLAGGNVCAPTRSALMTGQHTGHTTVRANSGGASLRADDVTIAQVLKQAGYTTGGFGKWGLGDVGTTGVPEEHGFDVFFGYYHQVHAHSYFPRYLVRNSQKVPLEGNTGDPWEGQTFSHHLIHGEGLKFIRENAHRPFFAYLAWTPPHGHWGLPDDEPAWQKYEDEKWDAADQQGEGDAQKYAAMIEMVDRQIGEILALLEELEIEDRTIVFVCGDNGGQDYFKNASHPHGFFAPNLNPRTGERFRGGKREFYEGGLRIPFLVRWPGRIQPGSVSEHLGYFPDVMPTLAELAGTSAPKDTDGISIVPTLLGPEAAGRPQQQHEYLYWEDPRSVAVRMGRWKAVRPDPESGFELYDLSIDLGEQEDVAAEHPNVLATMKQLATDAHRPPEPGQVLDPSVGFKGHDED